MKSLVPLLLIQGVSPSSSLNERSPDTNVNKNNQNNNRKRKAPNHIRGRSLESPDNTNEANTDPLASWTATSYLSTHPYYPSHSSSTCLDSRIEPAPEWMTLQGGYAENHLFETLAECCERWGFDDCVVEGDGVRTGMDATAAVWHEKDHEGEELLPAAQMISVVEQTTTSTIATRPATVASQPATITTTAVAAANQAAQAQTMDAALNDNSQLTTNNNPEEVIITTFPTMSCGANISQAMQCNQLCLSGSECPDGQSCHSSIPCPSLLVAAAMGSAGDAILDLIGASSAKDKTLRNVCGSSYQDAESSCLDGYTGNFISCDDGAHQCPPDREICYNSLICPLPPTMAPSKRPTPHPVTPLPTVAPSREMVVNTVGVAEDNAENEMESFAYAPEENIDRKDKTNIVGIPVISKPAPPPSPHTISTNNASPYTLDFASLGQIAVASPSCTGGCPSGSTCVGNQAGGQLIKDSECTPCSTGQTWWPCDVPGLCWCWIDGTDRIAPAPESGLEVESSIANNPHYTVCDDILTEELFNIIAPDHQDPYSYTGLCDAILSYNAAHTEKAFGMGDVYQRAAELAAFLGNTLHESDEFRAGREYLMCADRKTVGDEVYCKPCDSGSFDWANFKCPQSLISGGAEFNEYCQPSSVPPEACNCGEGRGQSGELEGYVPASDLFFGRGAIQLSWNYNYIGASIALTGSPDTFCDNPDLVATEGKYAWGAGLFFWMEHSKEGTTCHIESLKNMDFGGTLNNINGGLECPAHGGWHEEAVKMRLNRYCRASKALGLPNLMTLSGCAGLEDKMTACLAAGTCDDCKDYVGTKAGDHPANYKPPVSTHGAGASAPVHVEHSQPESSCAEGLMPVDGHPECCVPNPNFIGDGACDPEAPYNTAACGWDGGDCCRATCNTDAPFGCKTKQGSELGAYGPFGFYCLDPSQSEDVMYSSCNTEYKEQIGDGKCNPGLNNAACNFDGGDCCEETCDTEFGFYPCGSNSYVCVDPRFKVVQTSAPMSRPTRAPLKARTNPPTQVTGAPTKSPTAQTREPTKLPTSAAPVEETGKPTRPPTSRRPTRLPTLQPQTSRPTPRPSPNPSRAPTKDTSSESLLSDSFASADQFIEGSTQVSNVDTPCPLDFKECKNTGLFVGRDPEKNCRFRPCTSEETTVETTPPDNVQPEMPCPSDFKECKNGGIFVSRDPSNDCKFNPCPEANEDTQVEEIAIDSPLPNSQCQSDFKECRGTNIFVSRDPSNNCKFKPCPEREEETESSDRHQFSSMIEAAIQGKDTGQLQSFDRKTKSPSKSPVKNDVVVCAQDVKECRDGTFVSRDPSNHCKYRSCENSITTQNSYQSHSKNSIANSISESIGGLHSKGVSTDKASHVDDKTKPSDMVANAGLVNTLTTSIESLHGKNNVRKKGRKKENQ